MGKTSSSICLIQAVVAITLMGTLSQVHAVPCRIDGGTNSKVVHANAIKVPPLYLEVCEAVVRQGPVDVCYTTTDARMQCVAVKSGSVISAKMLEGASKDSNPMLAVISRWLQGDPSIRNLVTRGDDDTNHGCKSGSVRLPSGLLTQRAEQLSWQLSDQAIRTVKISMPRTAATTQVEAETKRGAVKLASGSLQFGGRYNIELELDNGCTARSNFRVVLREEQQAIEEEVQRITQRSDISHRSRALMISSLFDAEGFPFERDLWLLEAASQEK